MGKPNSVISFPNGPKEVSLYYGGIIPSLPNPFIATVVRLSGRRFALFRYIALDILRSNGEFRLPLYDFAGTFRQHKNQITPQQNSLGIRFVLTRELSVKFN